MTTTRIALAGIILGGVGTIGSIYSIVRQVRRERAQDRRRDEADVTARVESRPSRDGKSTQWSLVIENRGPSSARDVQFSSPNSVQDAVPRIFDADRAFPLQMMDVGQLVRLGLMVIPQASRTLTLDLTWVDDTGTHEKPMTLVV